MEQIGSIDAARNKVQIDIDNCLATIRRIATSNPRSLVDGIKLLRCLRNEAYEDLNQIQHEFAILRAVEWLSATGRYSTEMVWSWNPRQTGTVDEPDLRGDFDSKICISAEVTTSTKMQGDKFYFTSSMAMRKRAQTKISRASWRIETQNLGELEPGG
jgi:hypothetical protein